MNQKSKLMPFLLASGLLHPDPRRFGGQVLWRKLFPRLHVINQLITALTGITDLPG